MKRRAKCQSLLSLRYSLFRNYFLQLNSGQKLGALRSFVARDKTGRKIGDNMFLFKVSLLWNYWVEKKEGYFVVQKARMKMAAKCQRTMSSVSVFAAIIICICL